MPIMKCTGRKRSLIQTLQGDLDGARYTFLVCINLIWNEAVDPYAKSVTVNGKHGVVIDLEKRM